MSKSNSWNCPNGNFALKSLDSLIIEEEKQRSRRSAWVKWLRDNWDRELCGAICVCPSETPGKYHVPDGGHRLILLLEKCKGTTQVMCQVVSGPEKFKSLNDHLSVNPNDIFKSLLGCGQQPEVKVAAILKENGIGVVFGGHAPLDSTASPSVFLKMYNDKQIGHEFSRIVEMLVNVYRREQDGHIDPGCLSADFLRGLMCYLVHTDYTLEQTWAALQLSTMWASDINAEGRQRATTGGGRWKFIAEVIGEQVKRNIKKVA